MCVWPGWGGGLSLCVSTSTMIVESVPVSLHIIPIPPPVFPAGGGGESSQLFQLLSPGTGVSLLCPSWSLLPLLLRCPPLCASALHEHNNLPSQCKHKLMSILGFNPIEALGSSAFIQLSPAQWTIKQPVNLKSQQPRELKAGHANRTQWPTTDNPNWIQKTVEKGTASTLTKTLL
jgi:hypothetical protein